MDASFGPSGVTCAALELRLQNGQVVFFDPSYHFGIRIGGIEQEATWRKNWPGAESLDVWSSQAGFHR